MREKRFVSMSEVRIAIGFSNIVSDHQHPYFFERTPGGILVR